MEKKKSALVVLSGGQDSTTALFWALNRFEQVNAVSFRYGQIHERELECAYAIAQKAGVSHITVDITIYEQLKMSSLVQNGKPDQHNDLPLTFVPGRNLLFLTYAAITAFSAGISDIIAGMSQVDYSGYPDCRIDTVKSLEKTLQRGMEYDITIHTPLMDLSKAEIVKLAQQEGCLDMMAYTHTCYKGKHPPCGTCQACVLRKKGFNEAGIEDPLTQRS